MAVLLKTSHGNWSVLGPRRIPYVQIALDQDDPCLRSFCNESVVHALPMQNVIRLGVPPDHLLLDRTPNIGPIISRWELDKFKNY
jgi:hypothetical protein